eukprot:m.637845 g.637845  ORF g.637845 m.637845 type:complete len:538 (-) comp58322_c0_seq1:306-1919(-)
MRWVSLAAGICTLLVSGAIYLVPAYSGAVQTLLQLSNQQTSLMATMANAGNWIGVGGGLFYDRFGVRPTVLVGAAMVFIGYVVMWLAVRGEWSSSVGVLAVGSFLTGQGSGWMYSGAVTVNAGNYSAHDRGRVLAILSCSFALCGGVFTQLYKGFFSGGNVSTFLLFLTITLPTTGLVMAFLMRPHPLIHSHQRAEAGVGRRVMIGYCILGAIAAYVCLASLLEAFTDVSAEKLTFGLLPLLAAIGLLPIRAERNNTLATTDTATSSPILAFPRKEIVRPIGFGQQSLPRAARLLEFWLLVGLTFSGIGSGVTIINNIASIVQSRESVAEYAVVAAADLAHHDSIAALVAMFSVLNAGGRLLAGFAADVLHRRSLSRSWVLLTAMIVMTAAQILAVWASIDWLFLVVFLIGICEGTLFSVLPTLTLDLFGIDHFGANWSAIMIGSAVGSVVMGTAIVGTLSDNIRRDHYITVDGNRQCFGSSCYAVSIGVTSGVSAAGCLLCLWLCKRLQAQFTSSLPQDTPVGQEERNPLLATSEV